MSESTGTEAEGNLGREIALPRRIAGASLTTNEIEAIGRTVFVANAPQQADVLFVFGAGNGRWDGAARLFHDGFAPNVLATGGRPNGDECCAPESHQIRDHLVALGVPGDAILLESESTNTLENVRFGLNTLAAHGMSTRAVLFVTKSHHGGRAWRTLTRWLPDPRISCVTYDMVYDGVPVRQEDWWHHEISRERVLGEYHRILRYAARGDITGDDLP
jgi:uncharacterized SAM-binding protein YcdF (DUF218 family)